MIGNYSECGLALKCTTYDSSNPCEKPTHRFLRKPKCYVPKKQNFILDLPRKFVGSFMEMGEMEN